MLMAYDARENLFLSVDIQDTSTMDLQDHSLSSPISRLGIITLVDDLDNKGDLFCSGVVDTELRSQQYTEAIHLTSSSDNLLGHWWR